jgi:hypothetical protein
VDIVSGVRAIFAPQVADAVVLKVHMPKTIEADVSIALPYDHEAVLAL